MLRLTLPTLHVCALALAAASVGGVFQTSAIAAPIAASIALNPPATVGMVSGATSSNSVAIPPPPKNIRNTAEPISGTLFFTREQREQIDRARKQGYFVEVEEGVVAEKPRRPVINGFVKRSDGADAVWINGECMNLAAGAAESISATDVGSSAAAQRVQFVSSSAKSITQTYPSANRKAAKKMKRSSVKKAKRK